jgi:hypothetical protein
VFALIILPCRVLKAALRSPRSSKYAPPEGADSVLDMLDEKGYFAEWPGVLRVTDSPADALCATALHVAVARDSILLCIQDDAESTFMFMKSKLIYTPAVRISPNLKHRRNASSAGKWYAGAEGAL